MTIWKWSVGYPYGMTRVGLMVCLISHSIETIRKCANLKIWKWRVGDSYGMTRVVLMVCLISHSIETIWKCVNLKIWKWSVGDPYGMTRVGLIVCLAIQQRQFENVLIWKFENGVWEILTEWQGWVWLFVWLAIQQRQFWKCANLKIWKWRGRFLRNSKCIWVLDKPIIHYTG